MRRRRWVWGLQALVLGTWLAAAVLFVALPAALAAGWFDSWICERLGRSLDAGVSYARIELEDFHHLRLRDLRVVPSEGPVRHVRAPEVVVRWSRIFPFGGPETVTVVEPEVLLDTAQREEHWLEQRAGGDAAGELPHVIALNGRVRLRHEGAEHEWTVERAEAERRDGAWDLRADAAAGRFHAGARGRAASASEYEFDVTLAGPLRDAAGPWWPGDAGDLDAQVGRIHVTPALVEAVDAEFSRGPAWAPHGRAARVTIDRAEGRVVAERAALWLDLDRWPSRREPPHVPEGLPEIVADGCAVEYVARSRRHTARVDELRFKPDGKAWEMTVRARLEEARPGTLAMTANGGPAGEFTFAAEAEGDFYETFGAIGNVPPPADPIRVGAARIAADGSYEELKVSATLSNVEWPLTETWRSIEAHAELTRTEVGYAGWAELAIQRAQRLSLRFDAVEIDPEEKSYHAAEGRLTEDGALLAPGFHFDVLPDGRMTLEAPEIAVATAHHVGQWLTGGRLAEWPVEGVVGVSFEGGLGDRGAWVQGEVDSDGEVTFAHPKFKAIGERPFAQVRWEGGRFTWDARIGRVWLTAPDESWMEDLGSGWSSAGWATPREVEGRARSDSFGTWELVGRPGEPVEVHAKGIDAGAFYARFRPLLGLPGGELTGELKVDALLDRDARELRWGVASGRLSEARFTEQTRLTGVEFEMPLLDGEGRVSVDGGEIPGGTMEPSELTVRRAGSEVEVAGAAHMEIYDGLVDLTEIRLDVERKALTMRLDANRLVVERFGSWLGARRFPHGWLSGTMAVTMGLSEVTMDGLLEGDLCGGTGRLTRVELHDWLTNYAENRVVGSFDRVSLADLTSHLTDFGVIVGSVQGSFDVDVYKSGEVQELALEAELDPDVEREETPHLDVTALKSLMVVLEGPASARFAQLSQLPPSLGFDRLGARMRMPRGGRLTIRGKWWEENEGGRQGEYTWEELRANAVRPGTREYLVVGAGESRVNVINHTPGGTTRWQDLMDRIRELKRGR